MTSRSASPGDFPVFVVGPPRSGTTLLYHMLLATGDFPLYFAESMILACRGFYGSLESARNRRDFVEDFLRSRQFRVSGMEEGRFRELVEAAAPDYLELLRLFMEELARTSGKSRWIEKTPAHTWQLSSLARRFPTARFLHVVRDGRDVALSQIRHGMTPAWIGERRRQLLWTAKIWEATVTHVKQRGETLASRMMSVRYEDLVTAPESVLTDVGGFVSVDLSPREILESRVGTLERLNTSFGGGEEEGSSGLSRGPVGRWREQLSPSELRDLNWAIGPTLRRWRYEVEESKTRRPAWSEVLFTLIAPRLTRLRWWLKRHGLFGRASYNPLEFETDTD